MKEFSLRKTPLKQESLAAELSGSPHSSMSIIATPLNRGKKIYHHLKSFLISSRITSVSLNFEFLLTNLTNEK